MFILKSIGRVLLVIIAILVILLSVAGIGGAWYVNRVITDVTLQVFSVVETGVTLAETGVNQVNGLVKDSRTEVQQAEDTIIGISDHLQENSPALVALDKRLETRLAPTVGKIDAAIAPVRDGLVAISSIVQFANSIPYVQEQAPNLDEVEEVLQNVNQLGADIRQLNDTLAASVVEGKNELTKELAGVFTDLTTRIDTRLGEVQTEVESILAEINAFQEDVQAYKSRLLLIYNLSALALTLFFIWLIYSQVVVIQHQWLGFKGDKTAGGERKPALDSGAVETAVFEHGVETMAEPEIESIADLELPPLESSAEA
jgi:archaellum component FlaC